MPMPAAPSTRPAGARTAREGDPFSNLLEGAGGKAPSPVRDPKSAVSGDTSGQPEEMDGEATAKAKDARAVGTDDEASPRIVDADSEFSPLQRLSKMFGILNPRVDDRNAAPDSDKNGIEDEEIDPEDPDKGETEEIEMPAGAAIALVAQAPVLQRETGSRVAEGTTRVADPRLANAVANEGSAEDGESADPQSGDDRGSRPNGAARTVADLSTTAAITAAADGEAAGENDTESGPKADPGKVSEQGDLRVKVVGDTLNVAPAPQNMRTVAGLAAAIAGDGEWRSAIEQMNTLETDVTRSQQAPLRDLKIQLNPANLGEVNARLRLTGEQLSVEIQVDTPEAYHRLSSERDAIVSSLRGLGFRVDDVTIQQQPQATGAQPQTGSGGRSGEASAGLSQGSGRDQGQPGGNQNRSNNSIPSESDANPSRIRPSADGIYI
ncbi:hypothetical protein BSQ44_21340 [Aquibium oceanicum]|uniref:Flagellar hook-length control protein-like C-terminal domain-containing protein n=1 Tax=Aquibium oceanicum TaxID=1670800 RepID=A0A1L3SW51_9HYPH|nr:hypothetical protein BSQ44_21340 [Aquibium oceanicum]